MGCFWSALAGVVQECDADPPAPAGSFIAAGETGSSDHRIYVSTDGLSFAEHALGLQRSDIVPQVLYFAPSQGVYLLALSGAGLAYRSLDAGVTWAAMTTGWTANSTSYRINAFAEGAGLLLAAGFGAGNSAELRSSSNGGASWTLESGHGFTFAGRGLQALAYGGGAFVVAGYTTGGALRVRRSTDGHAWNDVTPNFGATPDAYVDTRVCFGNNLFCAVTRAYPLLRCSVSADGQSWTAGAALSVAGSPQVNAFTFANGHFYLACGNQVFRSADGGSWDSQTVTGFESIYGLAPGAQRLLLVGSDANGNAHAESSANFSSWQNASAGFASAFLLTAAYWG